MDAWIICPFFLQGGRYTIEDVHYVADSERFVISFTGDSKWFLLQHSEKQHGLICIGICRLVPAGETEFAKDAAFGYRSSNLREVFFFIIYLSEAQGSS